MAAKEISGDGLASNLAGMSKNQLYEIMSQMKTLIEQNQQQARQILIQNPLLTKALFQAQIMLGMLQSPQVIPNLQPQASKRPQQPAPTVQQTNVPVAQSLPSQVGLQEQTNSSQAQIPARKQQQNQSSTPMLYSQAQNLQSQPMPSQSVQHLRSDLGSQATSISLAQSAQSHNMPPLMLHSGPLQPPVHQPPAPPVSGHLQRPMQTTSISHLPLQPLLPPQSRPPIVLNHQHQSQMGSNMSFQHPDIQQSHLSQPPFHSSMKPPGALGLSFPHGQPPLPNQLPPLSLYQGGGQHIGPDFLNQGGSSMQKERVSAWPPALADIAGGQPLPGPSAPTPQLGRGPMGLGNQPLRPPPLTPEMEQALLQQVMSLTPEQINLLPPEQRHQVLQLQQMLRQ
ncbi:hypothetical protein Nepgr_025194 [Nepenthes gracilis]|uniref:Cleavage stimulating factor 64 n=1 Tax=Nepenthes gracilis TaxID=150966 RepID=A0AAD3T685_NEPGR|nr:hypothetical protein Nepgr_025194 [Nepenthes gracilis]